MMSEDIGNNLAGGKILRNDIIINVESTKITSKENVENTPSWEEFINNTTFHGVRYIFGGGFKTRRILWFLVVLVAVGLFLVQVSDRIMDFFKHKTNVDVRVMYVDRVEFPSVTICNQNNYRISATAELRAYKFIDDIYNSTNFKEFNVSDYGLENMNTAEFVIATAHQKEDLLHECTWRGKTVNVSESFETVITDMGLCFSFNTELPTLYANESGSNSALHLTLNAEQYEYMKGEGTDAGVKILLHDQGEVPQMKDQGFAVAPGTHTLVAIERAKVTSLPDPYGDCEEKNPVPVSLCRQKCKSHVLVKVCGCLDVYMELHSENGTSMVCDMGRKYNCIRQNSEFPSCTCPVPCKRVQYKPNLSYSQLSYVNVERFIIPDERTRAKLQEKLNAATEAVQRNVLEIVKDDLKQIRELNREAKKLGPYIERLYAPLSTLASTFSFVNFFSPTLLEKDYNTIQGFLKDTATLLKDFIEGPTHIYQIENGWLQIANVLGLSSDNGSNSQYMTTLQFCATTRNVSELLQSTAQPFGNKSTGECDELLDYFKRNINFLHNFTDIPYGQHLSNLETVFINATFNYRSVDKYQACIRIIDQLEDTIISFQDTLVLSAELANTTNFTEALNYVQEILSNYDKYRKLVQDNFDDKLREACTWTTKLYNDSDLLRNKLHWIIKAKDLFDQAANLHPSIQSGIAYVKRVKEKDIDRLISETEKYIAFNQTKLDLATYVISANDILKALESLFKNVEFHVNTFNRLTLRALDELRTGFKELMSYDLPCINTYNVYQLEMVKEAVELAVNSRWWNRIISSLPESLSSDFISESRFRFGSLVKDYENIGEKVKELLTMYDTLLERMVNYQKSTALDNNYIMNNFIQVDIFYPELRYEEIEQNKAFEFLSLLSEIGGFLGLLLGASVVTVCELLDYIILTAISKVKRRKQNERAHHKEIKEAL